MPRKRKDEPEVESLTYRLGYWCKRVGVVRQTGYNLIERGEIESITIGKSRRVLTSPEEYIQRRKEAEAAL